MECVWSRATAHKSLKRAISIPVPDVVSPLGDQNSGNKAAARLIRLAQHRMHMQVR